MSDVDTSFAVAMIMWPGKHWKKTCGDGVFTDDGMHFDHTTDEGGFKMVQFLAKLAVSNMGSAQLIAADLIAYLGCSNDPKEVLAEKIIEIGASE